MKRILLGMAVLAFIGTGMTACNSKKKDEAKTEQNGDGKMDGSADGKMDGKMDGTTDGKMEGSGDKMATADIEVPSFSDPEITQWCKDYKAALESFMAAYTSKDPSKMTSSGQEMASWAAKSNQIGMKMAQHPEEATKFSAFVTAITNKYEECMKMNMPH